MMFFPPFFNIPKPNPYYHYPYGYSNYYKYVNNKNTTSHCNNEKTCSSHIKTEPISDVSEDRNCFEIMGIKLYFDDILLICLIFFLYSEGVQDEMLFMALVLLLLS